MKSFDAARDSLVRKRRPRPSKVILDFGPAPADTVNHPKHYTSHPSGIECIQVTRHMSFNVGNAMKYLWRADLKNSAVEDLRKAIWYIEDEIKLRTGAYQKVDKKP